MPREAGKARLAIYGGQNMESELLWPLYDDMFTLRIPAYHMVIFWPLEERIELCEESGLWLGLWLVIAVLVLKLGIVVHGREDSEVVVWGIEISHLN